MTSDEIAVTLIGLAGIALTYWFFLMRKTATVVVADAVEITVAGGYSPEVIAIPKGKPTKLHFTRTDPNSCLEEVVLGDFKIRQHLPLNQKVTIEVTPQHAGEFTYTCSMNMYHGKIIVTESV